MLQETPHAQKRAAPTRPMKPATPNEVDMVRRLAAFAFEAPAEADAVEEDALLVLEDPEAVGEAAAEPLLLPPSDTVEFKQEELLPAWTVTMSEYAVSPVLSFKLMVKLVPLPRSVFQVYEVPD